MTNFKQFTSTRTLCSSVLCVATYCQLFFLQKECFKQLHHHISPCSASIMIPCKLQLQLLLRLLFLVFASHANIRSVHGTTEITKNLVAKARSIPNRLEKLSFLFNELFYKHGAEIGVWKGEMAKHVLGHVPSIEKYYLVDPWKHQVDWNSLSTRMTQSSWRCLQQR